MQERNDKHEYKFHETEMHIYTLNKSIHVDCLYEVYHSCTSNTQLHDLALISKANTYTLVTKHGNGYTNCIEWLYNYL